MRVMVVCVGTGSCLHSGGASHPRGSLPAAEALSAASRVPWPLPAKAVSADRSREWELMHGHAVRRGTKQFMCEELPCKSMWAPVETCGPPNACWEDTPRSDSPTPGTRFTRTHWPASILTDPCASPKCLLLLFSLIFQ